ncbi:TonB-dependent siderophore receptor [Steroidobacter sp.]|uniref:TonB-dependent siderophore receptor n=1 Tax=Steroidobacter sp. TaxID=1978227 RepID=UPI001A4ADDEE|nr:TonB-dependent siderophore receptor [Steroidobacter sp.]MBL8268831.1 TonB-dependent siderophore receptor [Steroidobacter sp.]
MKNSMVARSVSAVLAAATGGVAYAQEGARQAEEPIIAEVVVEGQPEFFRARDASSVARFDIPIEETPQSVTVMTEDFLRRANIRSLEDASRFVPGIAEVGLNGYGEPRSLFTARGLVLDLFSSFKLNDYTFAFQGLLDTVGIERIEFVRGPAAISYGVVSYGGMVNVVTKKAQRESSYSTEVTYGSYENFTMSADVTGPLTDGGDLRFRAGLGYQDGGSFRNGERHSLLTFVPEVVYDVSDSTQITATGYFQDGGNVAGGSIPVFSDAAGRIVLPKDNLLSRDTFTGNSDINQSDNEIRAAVLKLKHVIDDTTEASVVASYSAANLEVRTAYTDAFSYPVSIDPQSPDYGQVLSLTQVLIDDNEFFTVEASVQKKFEAFSREHTLFVLAGHQRSERWFAFAAHCGGTVNIFDFDTSELEGVFVTDQEAEAQSGNFCYGYSDVEEMTNYNIGSQAQIQLSDRLSVLAGARYDTIEDRHSVGTGTRESTIRRTGVVEFDGKVDEITMRLGAVYAFTPTINGYLTYVDGFTPQFSRVRGGGVVTNEKGTLYEVGTKGVFRNGALGINASLFLMKTSNTAFDDPANMPGEDFSLAGGESERKGYELEAVGQLSEQLAISASYAFVEAEITAAPDDPELVGKELRRGPKRSASFLVNYTFDNKQLKGLNLNAAVSYSSSQVPRFLATYDIPGFTKVDLNASYALTPRLEIGAGIGNVLDEEYLLPSGSPYGVNYGEPRTYYVSMRLQM